MATRSQAYLPGFYRCSLGDKPGNEAKYPIPTVDGRLISQAFIAAAWEINLGTRLNTPFLLLMATRSQAYLPGFYRCSLGDKPGNEAKYPIPTVDGRLISQAYLPGFYRCSLGDKPGNEAKYPHSYC